MLRLHSGWRKKKIIFFAEFPLQKVVELVDFLKILSYLREQHRSTLSGKLYFRFFFSLYCAALAYTNWLLFYIYSVASMPSPYAS